MLEGGAPVPGYLLWTNNEASVLIDTGYRTDTFDEDLDVDRMSRLGVNPADVHYR